MAQVFVDRVSGGPRIHNRLQEIPIDSPLHKALLEDKRQGQFLAVRARWIALTVIGVFLIYLMPRWSVLYYETILAGFAMIGWLQLQAGQVGRSGRELLLILADLLLMTFSLLVPNPFEDHFHPIPLQYHFDNFTYFYILLAAGTLAYSWRTVVAFGTWTSALWLGAMIVILLQPVQWPEVTAGITAAMSGHEPLVELIDPANVNVTARIQEVVVFLIVACTLALGGWRTNRLLVKQAQAAQERTNLARYFPPNIVDDLAQRDQPLGAVRQQQVAVMFADIVGFTRMAENQTPDQVIALLREFHARMEKAVFDHRGTLDKFLGDGLMATFGTPDPGPRDAVNAVTCAFAMQAAMDLWNKQRTEDGLDPIRLSIGVHYGDVVLGDIGSERRLEFAALGDAVNVAARLEALTRELKVRTIVSGECVDALRAQAPSETNDLLSGLTEGSEQNLRGRDKAVPVWLQSG